MANVGHGKRFQDNKSKILHVAAQHFLTKGYVKTTMSGIAKDANISNGSLFFAFRDKEALVSDLVKFVLDYQFSTTKELVKGVTEDRTLFFALERAMQLCFAESNEHLREMYLTSYTLPTCVEIIHSFLTSRLEKAFKEYLPDLQTKDFYEKELAISGIMRSYLTTPCNMYFTLDNKTESYLRNTLLVLEVDKEQINKAINFVKQFDLLSISKKALKNMMDYLESHIK